MTAWDLVAHDGEFLGVHYCSYSGNLPAGLSARAREDRDLVM